jgi:hypothetical protein
MSFRGGRNVGNKLPLVHLGRTDRMFLFSFISSLSFRAFLGWSSDLGPATFFQPTGSGVFVSLNTFHTLFRSFVLRLRLSELFTRGYWALYRAYALFLLVTSPKLLPRSWIIFLTTFSVNCFRHRPAVPLQFFMVTPAVPRYHMQCYRGDMTSG